MDKQLELKYQGMSLSAVANKPLLEEARRIAHLIGKERGVCTVEDIRELWDMPSGGWQGSIFKDGFWDFHSYVQSTHLKGHGRIISKWSYKRFIE